MQWIKLYTDLFEDERFMMLRKLPDRSDLLSIWFSLLILCGKKNCDGVLNRPNGKPYTPELLSVCFDYPTETIRHALETFETLEMIEIKDGRIVISDWQDTQVTESKPGGKGESSEVKHARDAGYMRGYRAGISKQLRDAPSAQLETDDGEADEASEDPAQDGDDGEAIPEDCKSGCKRGGLTRKSAVSAPVNRKDIDIDIDIDQETDTEQEGEKEKKNKGVRGKPPKPHPSEHKYGLYQNVLLSDADMEKLIAEFPDDYLNRIESLSAYMASKGTRYKNHLATIRAWAQREVKSNAGSSGSSFCPSQAARRVPDEDYHERGFGWNKRL